MADNTVKLPPMPAYVYGRECGPNEKVWPESSMREYATAAILADRQERAEVLRDAERFCWYFSDKPKGDWLSTYLDGVRTGWTTDQWRAAIDAAIASCTSGGTGEER